MSYVTDALADPQNILTLAGIAASAGFVVYDWLWRSRKVMVYRVQLDTALSVLPDYPAFPGLRVTLERAGTEIQDGSMVLLRVANGGSQHIVESDVRMPICFVFENRTVMGVEIPEAEPDDVKRMLQEDGGPSYVGSRLTLPRVPLNRGNHFKMLVLLSGTGTGVKPEGYLRGGKIQKGAGHWQGPSYRVMGAGIVATLLLGLLVGFLATNKDALPATAGDCASGKLDVYGSTAFEPVAAKAASAYRERCRGALINVREQPSIDALRALLATGSGSPAGAGGQIAMSDGLNLRDQQQLRPHPVAVILFSVAVNKSAGVHSLTSAQLQEIYSGRSTDWSDFGGTHQPIRVVSRGSSSGSRRVFDDKVLPQGKEGENTSDDCVHPRKSGDPFILCELAGTDDVLDKVNSTPGAIGFSEFSTTGKYADVQRVQINGYDADIETARSNRYPFWTVEYLYTYGEPAAGGLPAAFLQYMRGDTAKAVLGRYGHVPCSDDRAVGLCAAKTQ